MLQCSGGQSRNIYSIWLFLFNYRPGLGPILSSSFSLLLFYHPLDVRYPTVLSSIQFYVHLIHSNFKKFQFHFKNSSWVCHLIFCCCACPSSWQRSMGFSAHRTIILSQASCSQYHLWKWRAHCRESGNFLDLQPLALTQSFLRSTDMD